MRLSKVKALPHDLQELIHKLLAEGQTLDSIMEALQNTQADISRSSLGRYKQNFDKISQRMQESRETAQVLIRNIGSEATEGKMGRLLVNMINTLTYDYMLKRLDDPEAELEVAEMRDLARTLKDAAQATRLTQDFELKFKEEARKEAEAKLKAAVQKASSEHSNPAEVLEKIKAIYRGEA